MDIFQLIGDSLHLVAILLLLLKILASKNVLGLSYKTQELYLMVFLTRYSDMILEHHWGSVYFNLMRFIFLGITISTIYHMRYKKPYKHVKYLNIYRAMIMKQIHFLTIIYMLGRQLLPLSGIISLLFMESFSHFHGGLKLWLFCLSFT